jgi:hypothetical protein
VHSAAPCSKAHALDPSTALISSDRWTTWLIKYWKETQTPKQQPQTNSTPVQLLLYKRTQIPQQRQQQKLNRKARNVHKLCVLKGTTGMGIDQLFLRKQEGGKEERLENWWSGRVHGTVIVSAHVWRRWDARPCGWTALVVTKANKPRAERSKRGDGRRTTRHVVRDVPLGGASHAHFTCRRSKRATVS